MAKEALNAVLEAERQAAQIIAKAKQDAAAMVTDAKNKAAEDERCTLKLAAENSNSALENVKKECGDFTAQAAAEGEKEAEAYKSAVSGKTDGTVIKIIERLF